jgi:hypothetical protein
MSFKIIHFNSPFFVTFFTFLVSICFAQKSSNQLSTLYQSITDVTLKNVVYRQSVQVKNSSCIVSIQILKSDNQKEEEFECNLSDLNALYTIEIARLIREAFKNLSTHCSENLR